MTPDTPLGASPHAAAAALAQAGWASLQDRLLHAVCHDLNGRIGSMHALSYLIELGEPLPLPLGQEAERVGEIVRRIQLLVGDPDAPASAFAIPELLERALGAHAHLKDHDGPPVDAEVAERLPAVLVSESRVLRLLLLFVDLASRSTSVEGRSIEVDGDVDEVVLRFRPVPGADLGGLDALDRVARLDGGRVDVDDGSVRVRIPSLARARAATAR